MNLNMEQKKLIQSKPQGHALIKGVAGSGKTTVAIYKIPFLLNNYCFNEDDYILMVTFNKTLINYLEHLYKKVENEEQQMSLYSLMSGEKERVHLKNIDKIIYAYFQEYKKENKLKYNLTADKKITVNTLKRSMAKISKKYPEEDIFEQTNVQFLMDEIDWIKSCNYMNLEEYQNVDRIGRTSQKNIQGPQKLRKNSERRKHIFELMLLYNEELRNQGYIDFKDMALMALQQIKKCPRSKYTHIIVDESQDLTRVQIEILKEMYNGKDYSSIIFVADTAQNIYPHSWLVKGRSFSSIGFDMTGKSNILSKNYRTTTQIAEAAYSLVENDPNVIEDENYVKPSLIDREGSYPVYKHFNNDSEQIDFIIDQIKNKILKSFTLKDIAIIAKNKVILSSIKQKLLAANIAASEITSNDGDFNTNSVKLLTLHSIKGLEFPVVFIAGINEGVIPYLSYKDESEKEYQESIERKILYVGMTRANELLYMTSSGRPSKFINEINPKLLKIKENCNISKFYNINQVENYIYKERIVDIYSKEEKVRQWILKELRDNYKYPLGLVDIEYKINSFSKVGFVDIVVIIYKDNKRIPYIFIETKAPNMGIEDALGQLKSYMSTSSTCHYGIATDGNSITIIDKDLNEIDDIPYFNTNMLPSSISNYKYLDIKHNKTFNFMKDDSLQGELTLKNEGISIEFKEDRLKRIPVYGNIAAGIPIQMNEEIESKLHLPLEWFSQNEQYFVLKVKGDSMIGANINSGDYVIIKAQSTADNRDIVAAADGEKATLKRFTKMGDSVILMPENPNYEPIMLRSEDARIMGVAVGVWKKE
ncbi:repressor LexA [Clostridium bovifaecis]|uniref:DNA 3'-5' helicase n=1 Tax=Clostridium bovifaecis TaxID=2184719 RepID=A0A6I6EQS3_9CLOT|nr:repressor LexA [Clostridium bovifaecis]